MNSSSSFVVRGVSLDGTEVFYTGRAGEGWVSGDRGQAFTYQSLEGARRQAGKFNSFTALHGYHFMVPVGDAQ